MQLKQHTYSVIGMALMALLTLASCHREEGYSGTQEVRFRLFAKEHISVSRGYKLLGTQAGDTTLANFTAGLYVTLDDQCYSSTMTWNGTTMSAGLRLGDGTYQFFSYMPYNANVTFDKEQNTITLPNIKGLGSDDIMVADPVEKVISGSANNPSVTVPLYMDHLLARVTPYFYVHEEYAKMRTIKIKKVEMIMPKDTLYTATVNNTITGYSVTWDKGEATTDTIATAYAIARHDTLTTIKGEQEYGNCYLCPEKVTEGMRLRVTYDVYDTADNITRKDAVVENRIKRLPATLTAGTDYKLHVKIVPTYLYSLSDNDNEVLIVDNN